MLTSAPAVPSSSAAVQRGGRWMSETPRLGRWRAARLRAARLRAERAASLFCCNWSDRSDGPV